MRTLLTTTLHSTKNGSDKLYIPALVQNPSGGFDVTAQNGPRGGTLVTQKPKVCGVDEATARKAYEKLVASKISGGYVPIDSDPLAVAVMTELAGTSAGIPILHLVDIAETEAERYINDDRFVLQEKMNGHRRPVVISAAGEVIGVNKKGSVVPVSQGLTDALRAFPGTILDGELIGGTLYVFDAQQVDGTDIRALGFAERYARVAAALASCPSGCVVLVPIVSGTAQKRAFLEALRARKAEGGVFKDGQAPYVDGHTDRYVKHKFTKDASFIVSAHNARHSVAIAVYDGPERVPIGNVTIPPSMSLPTVGAVIDVRYLTVLRGGSLQQPVFLTVRDDVDPGECSVERIEFALEAAAA